MPKFTITVDSEEPDYEYTVKALILANKMKGLIDDFYDDVLRDYNKYKELDEKQRELLEEIIHKTTEHFEEVME